MTNGTDIRALVNEKLNKINANKEAIIEAWVAQTGISPEYAVMVQQETSAGTRFWVEAQADRCHTHRAEIASLRADMNDLVSLASSVLTEDGVREKLSCYVQGCRFMEAIALLRKL